MIPERIVPYVVSSNRDNDDASMEDAENIFSRTELDSHANMVC